MSRNLRSEIIDGKLEAVKAQISKDKSELTKAYPCGLKRYDALHHLHFACMYDRVEIAIYLLDQYSTPAEKKAAFFVLTNIIEPSYSTPPHGSKNLLPITSTFYAAGLSFSQKYQLAFKLIDYAVKNQILVIETSDEEKSSEEDRKNLELFVKQMKHYPDFIRNTLYPAAADYYSQNGSKERSVDEHAFRLFKLVEALGEGALASAGLGGCYYEPKKEDAKALAYLIQAQKIPIEQRKLRVFGRIGWIYFHGGPNNNPPKNLQQAFIYFQKSLQVEKSQEVYICLALALCHLFGLGTPQNIPEAISLFSTLNLDPKELKVNLKNTLPNMTKQTLIRVELLIKGIKKIEISPQEYLHALQSHALEMVAPGKETEKNQEEKLIEALSQQLPEALGLPLKISLAQCQDKLEITKNHIESLNLSPAAKHFHQGLNHRFNLTAAGINLPLAIIDFENAFRMGNDRVKPGSSSNSKERLLPTPPEASKRYQGNLLAGWYFAQTYIRGDLGVHQDLEVAAKILYEGYQLADAKLAVVDWEISAIAKLGVSDPKLASTKSADQSSYRILRGMFREQLLQITASAQASSTLTPTPRASISKDAVEEKIERSVPTLKLGVEENVEKPAQPTLSTVEIYYLLCLQNECVLTNGAIDAESLTKIKDFQSRLPYHLLNGQQQREQQIWCDKLCSFLIEMVNENHANAEKFADEVIEQLVYVGYFHGLQVIQHNCLMRKAGSDVREINIPLFKIAERLQQKLQPPTLQSRGPEESKKAGGFAEQKQWHYKLGLALCETMKNSLNHNESQARYCHQAAVLQFQRAKEQGHVEANLELYNLFQNYPNFCSAGKETADQEIKGGDPDPYDRANHYLQEYKNEFIKHCQKSKELSDIEISALLLTEINKKLPTKFGIEIDLSDDDLEKVSQLLKALPSEADLQGKKLKLETELQIKKLELEEENLRKKLDTKILTLKNEIFNLKTKLDLANSNPKASKQKPETIRNDIFSKMRELGRNNDPLAKRCLLFIFHSMKFKNFDIMQHVLSGAVSYGDLYALKNELQKQLLQQGDPLAIWVWFKLATVRDADQAHGMVDKLTKMGHQKIFELCCFHKGLSREIIEFGKSVLQQMQTNYPKPKKTNTAASTDESKHTTDVQSGRANSTVSSSSNLSLPSTPKSTTLNMSTSASTRSSTMSLSLSTVSSSSNSHSSVRLSSGSSASSSASLDKSSSRKSNSTTSSTLVKKNVSLFQMKEGLGSPEDGVELENMVGNPKKEKDSSVTHNF